MVRSLFLTHLTAVVRLVLQRVLVCYAGAENIYSLIDCSPANALYTSYWDEHELIHPKSDTQVKYPNWEWAELDERRLVWATEGKLFCGNITSSGINNEQELYDFNSMEFEPIEAPY